MRYETGSSLPDALAAQIYQRTCGIPLLVEEFTRLVGPSLQGKRDIPSTLQELVLARLDHMSASQPAMKAKAA